MKGFILVISMIIAVWTAGAVKVVFDAIHVGIVVTVGVAIFTALYITLLQMVKQYMARYTENNLYRDRLIEVQEAIRSQLFAGHEFNKELLSLGQQWRSETNASFGDLQLKLIDVEYGVKDSVTQLQGIDELVHELIQESTAIKGMLNDCFQTSTREQKELCTKLDEITESEKEIIRKYEQIQHVFVQELAELTEKQDRTMKLLDIYIRSLHTQIKETAR